MSHAMVIENTADVASPFLGNAPEIARRVIGFVLANFADEIRLEDMADAAGMSRFNFCRRFHKDCGLPPIRWLWNFRVVLAYEFIALDPRWSLTDVAFACGFTSSAHFSRSFKAVFSQSPSAFRKERLAADGKRLEQRPKDQATSFEALFSGEHAILTNAVKRALTVVED